jgi:hypothetical protein
VQVPREKNGKRQYIRQNIKDTNDLEYCKNNWNKIDGCLNCQCRECIQPDDYDKFLPWENEGFYIDDERIEYEIERSIK